MSDPQTKSTRHHDVLCEMAKAHGWRHGAEIGVLKGKTLRALLTECPRLHMVAVDKWQKLPPSMADGAETYERYDMAACEREVEQIAIDYAPRVRILKGDSVKAAKFVDDASLDFVFIDAAHTTVATLLNIRAWVPKVRHGGMITGHDWWWPSVRDALDLCLPGWTQGPESVWSIPRDSVML